jgi:hypothetical protein
LHQNKQNQVHSTSPDYRERAFSFLSAVEMVLRPICRLLVRRGIDFLWAKEVLSRSYVLAVEDVAKEQGWPATDKRMAVFTGLPSAEVKRVRRALAANVDTSEPMFMAIERLLTTWHQDPRYIMQLVGLPLELPFSPDEGDPSFSGLVKENAPQLDPKEVLAELVETNHVLIVPETGWLRVTERAYIPERFAKSDSERFGRRVANYLETLYVNSRNPGRGLGHFDRHVSADYSLSAEDEARFHQLGRDRLQKVLEELDAFARSCEPVAENGRRVGAVGFFFVDTEVVGPTTKITGKELEEAAGIEDAGGADASNMKETGVIDTLSFDEPRGKK